MAKNGKSSKKNLLAPGRRTSDAAGSSLTDAQLVDALNAALRWEMRAEIMYAHYAAYVRGIYRIHLKPYFAQEAAESLAHAGAVRTAIVRLGGIAATDRDSTEIRHTTDYREMLDQAMATERAAAARYEGLLARVDPSSEIYDALQKIYLAEVRSIEELGQMI